MVERGMGEPAVRRRRLDVACRVLAKMLTSGSNGSGAAGNKNLRVKSG
jgi:hypothetical protein